MPLLPGNSDKIKSQNISEFHTGKTYRHTKAKFGKHRADQQAVAVAMRTAREYGKKYGGRAKRKHFAEGGADDEDESKAWGALPSPNGVPRITIPAPPVDLGDRPVPKQQGVPVVPPVQSPAPLAPQPTTAIAKPGQTIPGQSLYQDVAVPTKPAQALADVAGVGDVSRLSSMTPEEQAGMAISAMFMILGPGEGFAAREAAPAAKAAAKFFDLDPNLVKNFTKVGKQEGSNPGGWYEDLGSGDRYYIKTPPTLEHAKNEKLAAELYKAAGVPTPEIYLTQLNGKPAIASKEVEGQLWKDYERPGLEGPPPTHLQEHFPVDAWLANWDVIGLNNDNILIDNNNTAHRIDMGGALRYRAQGALKNPGAFGPEVTELQTMADPNKNTSSANVFGGMMPEDMQDSAKRIAGISDEQIRDLVERYGPMRGQDKLAKLLMDRRDSVVNQIVPQQNESEAIAKQIADLVVKKHGGDPDGIGQYLDQLYHTQGAGSYNAVFNQLPEHLKPDVVKSVDKLNAPSSALEPWRGPEPGEEWKPDEEGNEWWQSGDNAHNEPDDHFPIPEPPPAKVPDAVKLFGSQQLFDKILEGNLSKWEAKKAASNLWNNAATPLHAAAELWHVADELNPHTAEQLFRSLPEDAQEHVSKNLELLRELTGSSPFDKLGEVDGKYLVTHTNTYKAAKPDSHYLDTQKQFYKNVQNVLEDMKWNTSNTTGFTHALQKVYDKIAELYGKGQNVKPPPEPVGNSSSLSSQQKDAFVAAQIKPIPHWPSYQPEHVSINPIKEFPNLTHASNKEDWLQSQGFNIKIPLYKGGHDVPKGSYPDWLPDPVKKGHDEPGFFAADHPTIAQAYGPLGGKYIGRADKAAELNWKNISASGLYNGSTMSRAIKAARSQGYDLLVVHHIEDVGSGNPDYFMDANTHLQTQYIFLNTKGKTTLRSPEAKFAPEKLHEPLPLAGIAATAGAAGAAAYEKNQDSRRKGGRIGTMSKADQATQALRRYGPGGAPSAPGIKPKLNEFSQRFYRSSIGHPPGGGMPGVGNIKTPHVGMIHSSIPGRTDKINMGVKGGSYILPADVVSGVGQGNSMAGSAIINKMFSMGPYGSADKALPTPKVNYGRAAQSSLRMPRLNLRGTPGIMAAGGVHEDNHKPVPIIAAGGEMVIPPEVVLRVGHGNLKHGHEILDHMVLHLRKKTIHDLKHLKPPKKK